MNRRLTDQFQLRLPPGLRDRIKAAAVENDRSMNAEIIAALEEAFGAEGEVVTRSRKYSYVVNAGDVIAILRDMQSDIKEMKDKGEE